jgi:signal recognition particle subunit SRP54
MRLIAPAPGTKAVQPSGNLRLDGFWDPHMKRDFTLIDFRKQLQWRLNPGVLSRLLFRLSDWIMVYHLRAVVPNHVWADASAEVDAWNRNAVGIIDAMTPAERRNPASITASRQHRIGRGAGASQQAVGELLGLFGKLREMKSR